MKKVKTHGPLTNSLHKLHGYEYDLLHEYALDLM